MIVYGSGVSPFVRKVLVVVSEKGLAAEHKPVRFGDTSPEFQATSPTGKIPGFSDGSYNLADSSAICQYLERKHPAPALYPERAEELGRAIWFDEYADTIMFGAFGPVFFNLFVVPRLYGKDGDAEVVARALAEEVPKVCAYLESQVSGPFLVGGRFSIADVAVASPFVNMGMVGHGVDTAVYPQLAGYLAGILARASFVKVGDGRR